MFFWYWVQLGSVSRDEPLFLSFTKPWLTPIVLIIYCSKTLLENHQNISRESGCVEVKLSSPVERVSRRPGFLKCAFLLLCTCVCAEGVSMLMSRYKVFHCHVEGVFSFLWPDGGTLPLLHLQLVFNFHIQQWVQSSVVFSEFSTTLPMPVKCILFRYNIKFSRQTCTMCVRLHTVSCLDGGKTAEDWAIHLSLYETETTSPASFLVSSRLHHNKSLLCWHYAPTVPAERGGGVLRRMRTESRRGRARRGGSGGGEGRLWASLTPFSPLLFYLSLSLSG